MLRFLGKNTASIAGTAGSSLAEFSAAVDDGLSAWELVSASQSDDEDVFSYGSEDVISDCDVVSSDSEDEIGAEPEVNPVREGGVDVDCVIAIQALSVSPPTDFPVEMTRNYVQPDDDDEEDDADDMYDYDVDDELVPWKLKDRYGKQRIKKMGKKGGGPKLHKSKGLPYYDNRPGYSYGKFRGQC